MIEPTITNTTRKKDKFDTLMNLINFDSQLKVWVGAIFLALVIASLFFIPGVSPTVALVSAALYIFIIPLLVACRLNELRNEDLEFNDDPEQENQTFTTSSHNNMYINTFSPPSSPHIKNNNDEIKLNPSKDQTQNNSNRHHQPENNNVKTTRTNSTPSIKGASFNADNEKSQFMGDNNSDNEKSQFMRNNEGYKP